MEHDEPTLRQMLEYIYTNRVKDMPGLSADEVIKLLALANGKGKGKEGKGLPLVSCTETYV